LIRRWRRAPRLRGSACRAGLRVTSPNGWGDRCSVARDCLFFQINSLFPPKNIPVQGRRLSRFRCRNALAVLRRCCACLRQRRRPSRDRAPVEMEWPSLEISATSSCRTSRRLVQIENDAPSRIARISTRGGITPVKRRPRVGAGANFSACDARFLKKLKTAMGGSCKNLAWIRARRRILLVSAPQPSVNRRRFCFCWAAIRPQTMAWSSLGRQRTRQFQPGLCRGRSLGSATANYNIYKRSLSQDCRLSDYFQWF
jgi:hypothetical protein